MADEQPIPPEMKSTWKWNSKKYALVKAIIHDYTASDNVLGQKINASPRSIRKWRKVPEFQVYLDDQMTKVLEKMCRNGLSFKATRIYQKEGRYESLAKDLQKRKEDFAMDPDAPSFVKESGFYVKKVKGAGTGPNFQLLVEWMFDEPFFNAFSNMEKEVAKEKGELIQKLEEMRGDPPPFLVSLNIPAEEIRNGGPSELSTEDLPSSK